MRIQLQNTYFLPNQGGIETYLYYLSRALIELGHTCEVFCYQDRERILPSESVLDGTAVKRNHQYCPAGEDLFSKLFSRPAYLLYGHPLKRQLRRSLQGVNLVLSRKAAFCYQTAKVRPNIPLIYVAAVITPMYQRFVTSSYSLLKRLYFRLCIEPQSYFYEKEGIRLCDAVVTLSKSRAEEIAAYYGFDSKRVHVVPPGVDLRRFKPRCRDGELMKELRLNETKRVVLTVSRLEEGKNLETLVRALSKVRCRDVVGVIVGGGSQRERLEEFARDVGVHDKLRFVGVRRDVERFYTIADVFVHPSTYEGFGHVYLEAMASGVPCIGLKRNEPEILVATEEIIKSGKTGWITEVNTAEAFARDMNRLIDDDVLRNDIGQRARDTCEKRFNWQACAVRLLDIYKTCGQVRRDK